MFPHPTGQSRPLPQDPPGPLVKALAVLAGTLPILLGFVLPASVLVDSAIANLSRSLQPDFWRAAMHSLTLALASAAIAVVLGMILAYACRATRSKLVHGAAAVAGVGYAVPGTVLAVGMLVPLASFDNAVDSLMRDWFGISTGLLLSGSAFAIVMACTVRFLAVSIGAIDAGLKKTSRSLDDASRTLGVTVTQTLWRVHLPMLTPVLGAASVQLRHPGDARLYAGNLRPVRGGRSSGPGHRRHWAGASDPNSPRDLRRPPRHARRRGA
jgi:iron(III) transport system permease protein